MGYIHEVEQGLRVLLVNMSRQEDREAIVRYCKDKILESYRNGQEAAGHGSKDRPAPTLTTATARVPRTFTRRR